MNTPPPAQIALDDDEVSCQSSGEVISDPSQGNETESSEDAVDNPAASGKEKEIANECISQPAQTKKTRISRVDNFLSLYCKWTSSSLLTEQGLKMAQYMAWLISDITKENYKKLSPALRKLYSDLSMMRYILRLYGMPVAVEGARSGSWSGGKWKDNRIHYLAKIMAWSMVIYHPLEGVAYFKWTMPKLLPKGVNGNKYSVYSCRLWLAYVVADFVSSILKDRELEERKMAIQSRNGIGDGEEQEEREALEKSIRLNRLQMVRNIFFAGPCANWSLIDFDTNPLLSEKWVNGLCFAEAVTCIYQSIYNLVK